MPSTLDVLALLGEDALQNHYNLLIPFFPLGVIGDIIGLNLRATSCEIPAQTIGTYTITKRGKTLTRPSGVSEQGNDFTFSYRPDKSFLTYNAIAQWLALVQNPMNGSMASDSGPLGLVGPSLFRVPLSVQAIDANNVIRNIWIINGCYPISQDALSFSEETGDPFEVSVTMNYSSIWYPTTLP